MPFGAHIITLLEEALTEGFLYHSGLDLFIQRAGISSDSLKVARDRAEERNRQSVRNFDRAPKRLVVQEILSALGHGTEEEDRLLASLVTAICKTPLPDASDKARAAIESLRSHQISEQQEAKARRDEQRAKEQEQERSLEKARAAKAAARDQFYATFLKLLSHENPQERGLKLEKFLNEYLSFEEMNPRGSFKLIGEQIDGSFSWVGRTHLVEAKWVKEPVGGAEFSSLVYKIDGKTADTRGLFISINGYSTEAIRGLKSKGNLRFICIDGTHLMRCLTSDLSFSRLMETLWRHADETGEAYLPAGSETFIARMNKAP